LGAGILGSASSTKQTYAYSAVASALVADASSADDATATANLPAGSAVNMLIIYTSNSPNGSGSATPYLDNDGDANNTTVRMTTANAKALGLLAGNNAAADASITFSSNFAWDFDRSNGIDGDKFDFVGVAVHEIGHALGFVSGVDILDVNSSGTYFADNVFTYLATPDLFRFSGASLAYGAGTVDWTANATAKYFSIDAGSTSLATFSTGRTHGDGQQASHWKDHLGIGIMDPTYAYGELGVISALDETMLDVIGWDIGLDSGGAGAGGGSGTPATPEPAGLVLIASAAAMLRRRRPVD
jgi:hypothetical protein